MSARDHYCPTCRSAPGEPCTDTMRKPKAGYHQQRIDRAQPVDPHTDPAWRAAYGAAFAVEVFERHHGPGQMSPGETADYARHAVRVADQAMAGLRAVSAEAESEQNPCTHFAAWDESAKTRYCIKCGRWRKAKSDEWTHTMPEVPPPVEPTSNYGRPWGAHDDD